MQSMNCPITAMQINLGEINGRGQYKMNKVGKNYLRKNHTK
jgi:hypothetical protein